MNRDEVFTVKEMAALLKVGNRTIYAMALAGDLPAFKVRGQWRFRKTDVEAWIDGQKKSRPLKEGDSRGERR